MRMIASERLKVMIKHHLYVAVQPHILPFISCCHDEQPAEYQMAARFYGWLDTESSAAALP
jgi:hypothetical protein